jgi:nitrous oxidase accessory protein
MSKTLALALVLVFLTASTIITFLPAKAENKTIVVPDDYPTIAEAIGNATNGDTILVRSGTYKEHSLVITKSLTLVGENAETTIIKDIDPSTPLFSSNMMVGPTAITISANNVTISGFTINNASPDIGGGGVGTLIIGNKLPDGIALSRGTYQTIAQNTVGTIHSEAAYTLIFNNKVSGSGTLGFNALILVQADPGNSGYENVVYNNIIIGNNIMAPSSSGNQGITAYMSHGNLIVGNTISNCYVGITLDIASRNTVSANTITTSFFGLASLQGSSGNIFYSNNVESNTYATAVAGLNNTLYDNNFINNGQQVGDPNLIMGPNPAANTFWFKDSVGNYWSNYNGLDLNQDGIGDTPFPINGSVTDPYPLMVPVNSASATNLLPQWVTIPVFNQVQFPAPTQSPKPTPTSTPTITPTPILNPTTNPTPTPTVPEFPSLTIPLLLCIMLMVAGLLVYHKKNKQK